MKKISQSVALATVAFLASASFASTATFNNDPLDYPTVLVKNVTVYPDNNQGWGATVSANPGDTIGVLVYYHNTGPDSATSTFVTLSPQTSANATTHTFSGTVGASNATTVTGSATIYLSAASQLTLVPGSILWHPNQTINLSSPFLNNQSGAEIFTSAGLNLGTILPGWATQGSVTLRYTVSGGGATQCPAGYYYSGGVCRPITTQCPIGYVYVNGACQYQYQTTTSSLCPAGYYHAGNGICQPTTAQCPAGSAYINGVCQTQITTQCPAGYYYSGGACYPISNTSTQCPIGYFYSNGACYPNTGTGGTQVCPDGTVIPVGSYCYNYNPNYQPQVYISANPTVVPYGGQTTLTWSASGNVTSCSSSWAGARSISGSETRSNITTTQTYTITCTTVSGQQGSASVTVFPSQTGVSQVTITASPTNIASGGQTTLTWNAPNASYCNASGGWTGTKAASGSEIRYNITQGQSFDLVCYTSAGQSMSGSVFVSVGGAPVAGGAGTYVGSNFNNAVTSIATRIARNSAQVNGIGVVPAGTATNGYFEWGTTNALGNNTQSRFIGSASTNNFSETLSGLSANTTYYYRAVISNTNGTFRGDILRFTTSSQAVTYVPTTVVPATQTAPQQVTYGRPAYVDLKIEKTEGEPNREAELVYKITYKNVTNRALEEVLVRVTLPEEFAFVSATKGEFNSENKTLTYNIGSLAANTEDSFTVRARVLGEAQVGKTVAVTAYAVYTIPSAANVINTQEEVTAYVLETIKESSLGGQLGAVGLFGDGFLPDSLLGWLLLIIVLIILAILLRNLVVSYQEWKGTKQ